MSIWKQYQSNLPVFQANQLLFPDVGRPETRRLRWRQFLSEALNILNAPQEQNNDIEFMLLLLSDQSSLCICQAFHLTLQPQVHVFKACLCGYRLHVSVIVCQTHRQRLCLELLRPPSALHPCCRDEMVRTRCFLWNPKLRSFDFVSDCQPSLHLSCSDQKALRLAKLSVALWVLAISCWISDRFGCSFWQRLNFCYLHGIW